MRGQQCVGVTAETERAIHDNGVIRLQSGRQQGEYPVEQHRHVAIAGLLRTANRASPPRTLRCVDHAVPPPIVSCFDIGCRQVPARPSNLAPGKVCQGR